MVELAVTKALQENVAAAIPISASSDGQCYLSRIGVYPEEHGATVVWVRAMNPVRGASALHSIFLK